MQPSITFLYALAEADGALDKTRRHKKRQLEDTLNLVLKKRRVRNFLYLTLQGWWVDSLLQSHRIEVLACTTCTHKFMHTHVYMYVYTYTCACMISNIICGCEYECVGYIFKIIEYTYMHASIHIRSGCICLFVHIRNLCCIVDVYSNAHGGLLQSALFESCDEGEGGHILACNIHPPHPFRHTYCHDNDIPWWR